MPEKEKQPETLHGALIEALFHGKDKLCYVAILIAMLGLFPHVLEGIVTVAKAFAPAAQAAVEVVK